MDRRDMLILTGSMATALSAVPLASAAATSAVPAEFKGPYIDLTTPKGNVNAASDSGVAGLLAHAAAEGALLNVEINLKSAGQSADKTDVEMSLQRIRTTLGPLARRCQDAVHAALSS
jgi:formiminotetrahydrofolate cyclodeaminase